MRTACVDQQSPFHDLGIWTSGGCNGSACRSIVITVTIFARFFFSLNVRKKLKEQNSRTRNNESCTFTSLADFAELTHATLFFFIDYSIDSNQCSVLFYVSRSNTKSAISNGII